MPTTRHTCTPHGGALPFGKLAPAGTCARCDERRNGAPAVKGWGAHRREMDARHLASIRAHFAPDSPHAHGACGPVCTFGDY